MNYVPDFSSEQLAEPSAANDPLFDYSKFANILCKTGDLLAVLVAAIVPGVILFGGFSWMTDPYRVGIMVSLLLTAVVFRRFDLYQPWRGRSIVDQTGPLARAWLTVIVILVVSAFLLKVSSYFSRIWLMSWLILGFLLLFSARAGTVMMLRALRSRGMNHKRVIIVGARAWGAEVASRIRQADWFGLDVAGFVDPDAGLKGSIVEGAPVFGHYDLLPGIIAQQKIDDVWICLPIRSPENGDPDHIANVLRVLRHETVNRRLVPRLGAMTMLRRPITEVLGLPVISLNIRSIHGLGLFAKRISDLILGSIFFVMSLPVMLLIAAVIKLCSRGPVFFTQRRHGWDGKPIIIYKFRTMYMHDEDESRFKQATRNDCRVTPVGRFLRASSLDELPQFVNVLQGRMSIVGPRPHAIAHNDFYKEQIESFMRRHEVKPGITGWAQVNGWRGETDTVEKMKRRVEYDLFYIEHWSLWFDMKIVFLTMVKGLAGKNAY